MNYIHVRNWDRFQHPDVARNKLRAPAWVRIYTALHSNPDFLNLTGHRRAVLLSIWIEYASSRRRLPDDTATLSRRFSLKVTRADLEALNHAGFIEFSASDLQADAAQIHTLEEKRKEQNAVSTAASYDGARAIVPAIRKDVGIHGEPPRGHIADSGPLPPLDGSGLETIELEQTGRSASETSKLEEVQEAEQTAQNATFTARSGRARGGSTINGKPLDQAVSELLERRRQRRDSDSDTNDR